MEELCDLCVWVLQMGLRSHSPPNALLGRMRLAHQQTDSSGASSMKTTGLCQDYCGYEMYACILLSYNCI